MRSHALFISLALFSPDVCSMDYMQCQQQEPKASDTVFFNWCDLPHDIKEKILYEYVGIDLPSALFFELPRDQRADHDCQGEYGVDYSLIIGYGSVVAAWSMTEKKVVWERMHGTDVTSVIGSNTGRYAAYVTKNGLISICDLATGTSLRELSSGSIHPMHNTYYPASEINDIAFSPDDTQLAGAGYVQIHVWDLVSAALIKKLGMSGYVKVRYKDKNIIEGRKKNSIKSDYWNIKTEQESTNIYLPHMAILDDKSVLSRDGLCCATILENAVFIAVSDMKAEQELCRINMQVQVNSVAWSLRNLIKKWRSYLIAPKNRIERDKKMKVDPLFAHMVLHKINDALAAAQSNLLLTKKEKLYFNLINQAVQNNLAGKITVQELL